MKTRILAVLFLLLAASQGWGAVYYASPNGSNTSPYDTWAKAANEPQTAIASGNGTAGPHTLYIAPGTYTTALALTNANWANGTVQGTTDNVSTTRATRGQVIVTNTTLPVWVSQAGTTVNDMQFQGATGSSSSLYHGGGSSTFNRCDIYGTTTYLVRVVGGTLTMNACNIYGTTAGVPAITTGTTGSVVANYCRIIPNASGYSGIGVSQTSSGTTTLNNCMIYPFTNGILASAGTVTVNNSIIQAGDGGSGSTGSYYVATQSGTGTLNINNSILIPSLKNAATYFSGTVGDTNNQKGANPKYTQRRRTGIIVPTIDDQGNNAYAESVAAELASRGLKGTWYFSPGGSTEAQQTSASTLAAGATMEIGSHSRTHSDLTVTATWKVTCGTAGNTINVDRTADNIVLVETPGGTVEGFKTKTLDQIRTALAGYGATNAALSYINGAAMGEILADTSGAQACDGAGYTLNLLIDNTAATGYFHSELVDGKSELETIIGTAVYSLAPPYGVYSVDLETAAIAAGFQSMRNNWSSTGMDWRLSSIDVYQLSFWGSNYYIGANDAATQALVRSICESIADTGSIVFLLSHDATEASIAEWQVVLDTIAEYPEITVTSNKGAMDIIRAGWATSDNVTFTKTYTDNAVFTLQTTSPAVNAGTSVSLTSDYAGNTVPMPAGTNPDIGAYEEQVTGGSSSIRFPGFINFPSFPNF